MRWSSGDSDLMTVSFSKTGTHFSQILFSGANFKSPKKVPGNVAISPIQTGWRVYLQWNLAVEYSWRQEKSLMTRAEFLTPVEVWTWPPSPRSVPSTLTATPPHFPRHARVWAQPSISYGSLRARMSLGNLPDTIAKGSYHLVSIFTKVVRKEEQLTKFKLKPKENGVQKVD